MTYSYFTLRISAMYFSVRGYHPRIYRLNLRHTSLLFLGAYTDTDSKSYKMSYGEFDRRCLVKIVTLFQARVKKFIESRDVLVTTTFYSPQAINNNLLFAFPLVAREMPACARNNRDFSRYPGANIHANREPFGNKIFVRQKRTRTRNKRSFFTGCFVANLRMSKIVFILQVKWVRCCHGEDSWCPRGCRTPSTSPSFQFSSTMSAPRATWTSTAFACWWASLTPPFVPWERQITAAFIFPVQHDGDWFYILLLGSAHVTCRSAVPKREEHFTQEEQNAETGATSGNELTRPTNREEDRMTCASFPACVSFTSSNFFFLRENNQRTKHFVTRHLTNTECYT